MLEPNHRRHLLESLRPPEGFEFDCAVGTTYTLDLLTLLTAPLAFTLFDCEDDDGRPVADPVAIVEALRRNAGRISVFCQAGGIAVPRAHQQLFAYLEGSVFESAAPAPGASFHPKLWVLRFRDDEGRVVYRVLCLSRNLTFDRSWDTALSLEGELTDRERAIAANHPLGDFVAALPGLARAPLPGRVLDDIALIEREIRRVKFEPPEGFREVRFWPLGLKGQTRRPFAGRIDRVLVVSPFLTDTCLEELTEGAAGNVLVSDLQALAEVNRRGLNNFERVYFLNPAAEPGGGEESADDDYREGLRGLHAKLYVADAGWDARVWTGSANATRAAFNGNVEFLVELVGRKSFCGIDALLTRSKERAGFADLLVPYTAEDDASPKDTLREELERELSAAKRSLSACVLSARVSRVGDTDTFGLTLESVADERHELPPGVTVRCWPVSLGEVAAVRLAGSGLVRFDFGPVSFEALTAFFAFELTAAREGLELKSRFVLTARLDGAPADRQERLLRSLLQDRKQVARLLLLLLAEGGVEAVDIILGTHERSDAGRAAGASGSGRAALPLLEGLVRALDRNPARLDQIGRLVEDLCKTPEGRSLLPEGFEEVWAPIWEARLALKR